MPGRSSFHTFERLLSRLAFDTFLFGTAIPYTSPYAVRMLQTAVDYPFAISIMFSGPQASDPAHAGYTRIAPR